MKNIESFSSLILVDIVIAFNFIMFSHINRTDLVTKFLLYYISLSIFLLVVKYSLSKFMNVLFIFYLMGFIIVKELFIIYFYIASTF